MVLSVDWVGTTNVRCEPSTHDVRMTGQDPASGSSCHWDLTLALCFRFEGLLDSIGRSSVLGVRPKWNEVEWFRLGEYGSGTLCGVPSSYYVAWNKNPIEEKGGID